MSWFRILKFGFETLKNKVNISNNSFNIDLFMNKNIDILVLKLFMIFL
jgi:hypothetical protein